MAEPLEKTFNSLKKVQEFDAKSLVRGDELGTTFAFDDTVEPAQNMITLFQQIPIDQLNNLPKEHLDSLKGIADTFNSTLTTILEFDPKLAKSQDHRKK